MRYLHVMSRPKVIDHEHDTVWTEAYVDSAVSMTLALSPLHGDFLRNPLPAYILYVIMTPCLHAKRTNTLSMQEECSEGNFQCKIQSRTLNCNEVLTSLAASCFVMLSSLLYSKRTCASLPSDHCSSSCCWNDCLL